ncbi:zinc finger protein 518A [Clupea harengus]|uniref:Zinc finger protein 518A n=1 Tax=Clupea harengus TaxID=7950 RepID=A0A6P3VLR0_CLUHA|nr:zinc finger protein 518A [Clupea harengus]
MEQNFKLESHYVDNDKGNWCKRLRSRKSTAQRSGLEQADTTENNSLHKGEQSDRKISSPPSPKEHQNQRATGVAEHTPTPQCESSTTSSEPKTTKAVYKASSLSAPPGDGFDIPPSGPSLPQGHQVYEDIKHTPPQVTKNLNAPHSLNGVFTCVRCKLYTKDVGTFLRHTHDVKHEPPLPEDTKDGRTSQSGDLSSYLSLASTTGFPLKYEFDQKPPQNDYLKHMAAVTRKGKERKYFWRNKEIQPKVEDDESEGLKLHLTKHPVESNSWMARGFLSLSGEGMLDEHGLLLKPEKTLEATNQYLERRNMSAEKSGKKFMIKEELKNNSRPATPVSLLLPKNGTPLPSEAINPSNNELAVLMERNNISIPPNCTTEVQGFKMVDGKKHLVLKVIPAAKQEITDAVEPAPCPTEHVMSNTITEPQHFVQTDPSCSVKDHQKYNGNSAHSAISTDSPLLGTEDANRSPLELAHVQCEDQGFCDGPNQGCDDNPCPNLDVDEDSHEAGDDMQNSVQEAMKQQLSKETLLKPVKAHTVSESTCGLLHETNQASVDETQATIDVIDESVDETQATIDVIDECLSPAPEGDSISESDGGFSNSQSPPKPDTLPASPPWPRGDGKEHSHTDDGTSIMDTGESHVPENNADGSEVSGTAESVKPLQGSDLSIQTTCPQNSETPCSVSSPDVIAEPITALRIVHPLTCTQDSVEKTGSQELSPLRTEKPVNNKRPREPSPDRSEEGLVCKSRKDVDSEQGAGSPAEAGCWEPSPRHVEKTLRLFPFSCIQLIKRPQGDQPVVVLNHPDADIPEVANIMRVVHKYGEEVQKVVLSQRTLRALSDSERNRPSPTSTSIGASLSPRRIDPSKTVKERFLLKLKLRRSGQNAYQVVSTGRHMSFRCWFCGRMFTKQEDFICHGQRHLMEATGDWNSWFKS